MVNADLANVPSDGIFFEIEAPKGAIGPTAKAYQVEGDALYDRYENGDILICPRVALTYEEPIGREAIVPCQTAVS